MLRTLPFAILLSSLALACAPGLASAQVETRVLDRNASDGSPEVLDRAAVAPLFADGAPATAARCIDNGDRGDCVDALTSWLNDHADHPNRREAIFLLGYLAHRDRQHALAVERLESVASEDFLLTDHALYFASRSAYSLENWADVNRLALQIPEDSVYSARAEFLRGRAMRRAEDYQGARRVLYGFVNAYPRASYIAEVELELAGTLVQLSETEAAAELYARVAHRYPGTSEESTARDALDDLLPSLPEATRTRLSRISDEDLLARAQVLFGRHRSRQVLSLLEGELTRLNVDTQIGCEATYLVAKSYSKLREHSNAVPFYQSIIASTCEDEDLRVKSLYTAGQALWNVDRDAESIAHFARLYNEHPNHTYADDAMLYEARIERSNDNEERFLHVLEEQVRRFPDGDMLGDAHWLLFEHEYRSGHLAQGVAFAEAIAGHTGENTLYNRGRIAYFQGRALQLIGDTARSLATYERVVAEVPLSYYALLSINRIAELDADRATALVGTLRASSGAVASTIAIEPASVARDAAFRRGILLLQLGLLDMAENQFKRLLDSYPNQDGPLWLVTFLYDSIGAYHMSHDIPRRRIESFLTAYPGPDSENQFRMAYPSPFGDEIARATSERNLDPYLVYAIMREESGFNPRAESWANARGLMQLMEGTASDMADRVGHRSFRTSQLFEPEVAITFGSEYLLTLSNRYDAHPMLVIAGYNGGQGNVDRFIRENGQLQMDRFVDYTKRVLMTYWIYHWLYDEDQPVVGVPMAPRTPSE